MKLLLVNTLYPPRMVGGAERSVALLAEALARDGIDVHVATLTDAPVPSVAVERAVTVHRLPIDLPYWPWSGGERSARSRFGWHLANRWNVAAARRVGDLLDELRPDLVHCHVLSGFSAAVWPEVRQRGIPLAQTLRDYALICPRAALFRRGRLCKARCLDCRALTASTRMASRLVHAVAGNSDYVLDAHCKAGRFDGVARRRLFNIVPGPGDGARQPVKGPLRFGFLGRIEPEKGIEVLLDAVRRIGGDGWSLRIGGLGRPDDLARYRAAADPRIEWLGEVNATLFYRSIDVLVIPSMWPEPLPRTLVEAAAHGCSVIGADSGGIPEVIDVAGQSRLYRADDAEALAGAMREAIDRRGEWRARFAPADVLAPFAESAVIAAHHDFYEQARKTAR